MSHIKPIVIKPNSLKWDKVDVRYPPLTAAKYKQLHKMKGFQGLRQHQIARGIGVLLLAILVITLLACYNGKIRALISHAKF